MELEINQEFQELIPALSKPEQDALTASLSTEGCRQPITVWKGKNIIVDGHNRYGICTMFNIPFATEEIEFEDDNEVKIWMINNQFARRNLSIEHLAELACTLAKVEQKLAEKRMLAGKKSEEKETLGLKQTQGQKGKSLKRAAEKAGISYDTAFKYDAIQRKGTDQQKEAVRSGKKKIGTVYKEIQAKPKEESHITELDLPKLFRSKFADEYLQGKYVLIYDVKVNDIQQLGTISNCNDYERITKHADSIMGMVGVICDKDDIANLRSSLKKVIAKFVIQRLEYEEEVSE